MSARTTTQPVPTSSVGRLIHRHPVAAFLVLVYGMSWPLYIPSFLSQSGLGLLPFELIALPFNLLAVIFGITLSSYIVTRVTRGTEGVRELMRHYTHWRVPIGWYLLALFAPPITALLGASLWLGTGPLEAFVARWQLLFTVFVPEALVSFVLINLWEEGGWTGFLLPRLQERWGPLLSSLMVAAAFGLFHVPLMFIVGGLSDERIPPDRYWFYLVFLFVVTPPVRVLVTWLWNSTRGSLIIVGLLHGAWNATSGTKFTPAFVPGDTLWVWGVYAALALVVIALTRGNLAYRGGPAPRPVHAGHPSTERQAHA
jgi:membrane protease YdiL (CAAX protease family)